MLIDGLEYLTRADAITYLGLEKIQFDNLSQKGKEITPTKFGNRWYVSKQECDVWNRKYNDNSVYMTKEEYLTCLDFAIRSYYEGAQAKSDFLSGEKREIGKYAHNIIMGKLAELSLAKFLFKKFAIKIELEFRLVDNPAVAFTEDVTKIITRNAIRNPRLNIEIKSSNKTSVHLLVPQVAIENKDRINDAYVFIRIHLYMNHLIRFFKQYLPFNLKEVIHEFEPIRAEIVGFAWKDDIINSGNIITEMDERPLRSGPNYHLLSGQLRASDNDWKLLTDAL